MHSPDIQILIPSHSLDDFPTEQTDDLAASLLNAFAIAFHPRLLAWTGEMPRWRRADDPPIPGSGQLVIVPTVSADWLPCSWIDDARKAGTTVVSGLSERSEMLKVALTAIDKSTEDRAADGENAGELPVEALSNQAPVIPLSDAGVGLAGEPDSQLPVLESENTDLSTPLFDDLAADFMALGTCWLLVEILTRKMRQFGNIDETRFFQRAHAGAKAAIAEDRETAEAHLSGCFEMLLEARERFYPVECYLLDLCLAVPDVESAPLVEDARQTIPWSLLATSQDLKAICEKTPGLATELSSAWNAGRISVLGGEDEEASLPLLPLESLLYHLERGRSEWLSLVGRSPNVWGRRRFGLTPLLPQILVKSGFLAAMHVVLDDGIYPDAEYTKLRWRGVDGTLIDAFSRIPLAAEGASSYLRFPARMAESMDQDHVAGLILARWPDIEAPWYHDLRRSQKYAPCLGRFISFDRFFEETELPGQHSTHKPNEYFSPILIQHVARREKDPIQRYTLHNRLRRQWDATAWCHAAADALMNRPIDVQFGREVEAGLESALLDREFSTTEQLEADLLEAQKGGARRLARIIMHGATGERGFLVLNPLSFTRRVVVQLPGIKSPPPISGPVKAIEFNPAHPELTACVVEVPGNGYAWIPEASQSPRPALPKQPLAEDWLLRNDHFEVAINERTGGIAHVRLHNQRAKRVSQQLSFRFPRERAIPVVDQPGETTKSQYAEMRCLGHEVVRSGTACGEIVTFGEIIDQAKSQRLAAYRQTVRVWRTRPTVDIEVELTDVVMPEGDPWNNYFASRFAWSDSTAVVTRSIYHSAQNFAGERFETSDYIEVASEDERMTIVPHGLAFHRKTGDRMVDSLLLVAGDTVRKFKFTIAIDALYPLEAAWNELTPAPVVPTEVGPPRTGATGWFFHLDSRHVQMTRLLPVETDKTPPSPLEQFEHTSVPNDPGFAIRLIETEGLSKPVKLRCFRQPTFARKRDFRGETLSELRIEGDAVLIDLTAFEIVDIELRFGQV
ncbi:hypothetical protein [Schlesneria sp. DSM 10557]|uniref:hypothetical protein n=1 Tax=Schlesneria sp. DSM 10557 TaxID=3044399 RepID=UPI00359F567B